MYNGSGGPGGPSRPPVYNSKRGVRGARGALTLRSQHYAASRGGAVRGRGGLHTSRQATPPVDDVGEDSGEFIIDFDELDENASNTAAPNATSVGTAGGTAPDGAAQAPAPSGAQVPGKKRELSKMEMEIAELRKLISNKQNVTSTGAPSSAKPTLRQASSLASNIMASKLRAAASSELRGKSSGGLQPAPPPNARLPMAKGGSPLKPAKVIPRPKAQDANTASAGGLASRTAIPGVGSAMHMPAFPQPGAGPLSEPPTAQPDDVSVAVDGERYSAGYEDFEYDGEEEGGEGNPQELALKAKEAASAFLSSLGIGPTSAIMEASPTPGSVYPGRGAGPGGGLDQASASVGGRSGESLGTFGGRAQRDVSPSCSGSSSQSSGSDSDDRDDADGRGGRRGEEGSEGTSQDRPPFRGEAGSRHVMSKTYVASQEELKLSSAREARRKESQSHAPPGLVPRVHAPSRLYTPSPEPGTSIVLHEPASPGWRGRQADGSDMELDATRDDVADPGGPVEISDAEVDALAQKEWILIKWRVMQDQMGGLEKEWAKACRDHNALRGLGADAPLPPLPGPGLNPSTLASDLSVAPHPTFSTTDFLSNRQNQFKGREGALRVTSSSSPVKIVDGRKRGYDVVPRSRPSDPAGRPSSSLDSAHVKRARWDEDTAGGRGKSGPDGKEGREGRGDPDGAGVRRRGEGKHHQLREQAQRRADDYSARRRADHHDNDREQQQGRPDDHSSQRHADHRDEDREQQRGRPDDNSSLRRVDHRDEDREQQRGRPDDHSSQRRADHRDDDREQQRGRRLEQTTGRSQQVREGVSSERGTKRRESDVAHVDAGRSGEDDG
eukprot:gene16947-23222_t